MEKALTEKLKTTAEGFAKKLEGFEITHCKRCFTCINDENGNPLAPTHECKSIVDILIQEMHTTFCKYIEAEQKDIRDLRYWAMQTVINSAVTDHLRRRANRRTDKAGKVTVEGMMPENT